MNLAGGARRIGASIRMVLLAVAGMGMGACAHTPPPPDSSLVVRAPAASQLFIDDVYAGLVRPVAFALRSGLHRVEVRAAGRLPAYREVTLVPGQRATIEVTLRPDLDAQGAP